MEGYASFVMSMAKGLEEKLVRANHSPVSRMVPALYGCVSETYSGKGLKTIESVESIFR